MISKGLSLFLFVIATSESRSVMEIKEWIMTKAVSCNTEAPVNGEELKQLMAHKIPDTNTAKCFIACVFKKVGWIDDKGMYDEAQVHKFAEQEYAHDATMLENSKKIYDACKVVNQVEDGPDGCERAKSLASCLLENAPKAGFDVNVM